MSRLIQHTPIWRHALPDSAAALAMAPDGKSLAVATLAGEVELVDLATGKLGPSGARHRGGALAVAWSPNGTLATAGQDGRVCLLGTGPDAGPVSVGACPYGAPLIGLAATPTLAAVATSDASLLVFNLASAEQGETAA